MRPASKFSRYLSIFSPVTLFPRRKFHFAILIKYPFVGSDTTFLIDGTDAQQEGVWRDSHNTILSIAWGQTEPNGGLHEQCLVIASYVDGYFADIGCHGMYWALCEIEVLLLMNMSLLSSLLSCL